MIAEVEKYMSDHCEKFLQLDEQRVGDAFNNGTLTRFGQVLSNPLQWTKPSSNDGLSYVTSTSEAHGKNALPVVKNGLTIWLVDDATGRCNDRVLEATCSYARVKVSLLQPSHVHTLVEGTQFQGAPPILTMKHKADAGTTARMVGRWFPNSEANALLPSARPLYWYTRQVQTRSIEATEVAPEKRLIMPSIASSSADPKPDKQVAATGVYHVKAGIVVSAGIRLDTGADRVQFDMSGTPSTQASTSAILSIARDVKTKPVVADD